MAKDSSLKIRVNTEVKCLVVDVKTIKLRLN